MKVAFFGTPDVAVGCIGAIHESGRHAVVCAVVQPDKLVGRKRELVSPPVKVWALANGIPVLQPERISREVEILDTYKPDIIVTCAFGQMLRQNVLDYAPHGVINVHFSLLPAYRGSSPVQWSIIEGVTESGITIMKTDIGMDTGPIILQQNLTINDNETAGDVLARFGKAAPEMLLAVLDSIKDGTVEYTPQPAEGASSHPMLKKEDGRIDWNKSATDIVNRIRGLNPWPIAYFTRGEEVVRVYKARVTEGSGKVGEVIRADKGGLHISCGTGVIELLEMQSTGGKVMSYRDFLNGRKVTVGEVFL